MLACSGVTLNQVLVKLISSPVRRVACFDCGPLRQVGAALCPSSVVLVFAWPLSDFSFPWCGSLPETVCGFVTCVGFELREFGAGVLLAWPCLFGPRGTPFEIRSCCYFALSFAIQESWTCTRG
jgi:hypothetical protein